MEGDYNTLELWEINVDDPLEECNQAIIFIWGANPILEEEVGIGDPKLIIRKLMRRWSPESKSLII